MRDAAHVDGEMRLGEAAILAAERMAVAVSSLSQKACTEMRGTGAIWSPAGSAAAGGCSSGCWRLLRVICLYR